MTQQELAAAAPGRRTAAVPDAVVALVVVGLGVFTLVDSHRITVPLSANAVGPRAFPYAVGVALVLAGGAVLVGALRGRTAEPEAGEDVDTHAGTDWLTVAKVVAAFAVHVVLVDTIGWALAAALLFGGVAWALGAVWWRGLAVGLVLGLVIQGLFVSGLGVSLPAGVLAGVPFIDG
ncbi:tripartite tricarboxylate transporter TctB family protein [Angustibacter peucedani]